MANNQIERRYKILSVPDQSVMDLVRGFYRRGIFALPNFGETIPEGSSVISVHYNYQSRCFELIIYNDIFDIVEPNYLIPHLPDVVVKTEIIDMDSLRAFIDERESNGA